MQVVIHVEDVIGHTRFLNTLETLNLDIKVLGEHNLEILEHLIHVDVLRRLKGFL